MLRMESATVVLAGLVLAPAVAGQGRPDPAQLIAAQKEAMARLAFMDGVWRKVGDRIMPGKEPVRIFEMNLKRVGDTAWPAAGAISPH